MRAQVSKFICPGNFAPGIATLRYPLRCSCVSSSYPLLRVICDLLGYNTLMMEAAESSKEFSNLLQTTRCHNGLS